MSKISNHTTPDQQRQLQEMKDKATRAYKAPLWPAVAKAVAQAKAFHLKRRDQKRAEQVANGQMKGGFASD